MIHKKNWHRCDAFLRTLFPADVDRSKCIHATSRNEPFCMHYGDDVKDCSTVWSRQRFHKALWETLTSFYSATIHLAEVCDAKNAVKWRFVNFFLASPVVFLTLDGITSFVVKSNMRYSQKSWRESFQQWRIQGRTWGNKWDFFDF